jgi:hypothetical protein
MGEGSLGSATKAKRQIRRNVNAIINMMRVFYPFLSMRYNSSNKQKAGTADFDLRRRAAKFWHRNEAGSGFAQVLVQQTTKCGCPTLASRLGIIRQSNER